MGSRALIPASQEPLSSQNMEPSPPRRRPPRPIRKNLSEKSTKAAVKSVKKANEPINRPAGKSKFIDSSDDDSGGMSSKKSDHFEEMPVIDMSSEPRSIPSATSLVTVREEDSNKTNNKPKKKRKKMDKKSPGLQMVRPNFWAIFLLSKLGKQRRVFSQTGFS